ncbi:UrcA family protein [Blastomonas sp. AAP53]|uniref:UrcA family protein n=1 Tax=Blastomonas sp. AAP53 TaxID=1248760 RepID=UPI000310BBD7|nr:UrcA family protein [Blastomonas sp. AAP53]
MFATATRSAVSRTLAAAAASAILFSASVQAKPVTSVNTADGRMVRTVEVPFTDLDLTTAQGAATLEARLKSASKMVCGAPTGPALRERAAHRECITESLASSSRAMVTLIARAEAGENFKPGERIAVGS